MPQPEMRIRTTERRRARRLWELALAASLASAACGGEAGVQTSAWSGEVQHLPGGAVLVSNPSTGIWNEQTRWRLEEQLRIGAVEGQGSDVFGRISALAVDSVGRIYVFDDHANELRVFGRDGAFLRHFGRQGPGPGEFEGVIGMQFAPDGALWIVDGPNARYTVLRGSNVEVHRRAHPRALRAFDPRGFIWTAISHEYRLVQKSLDGDTVRIVTRELDPSALTTTQQDSIRRYVRTLESQFDVSVTGSMVPRSVPVLRWFVIDDGGYLWVLRADSTAPSVLDVFDPEGRFLGEVELPADLVDGFRPLVRRDHFYGVAEGELGAQFVVRARIVRP